MNEIDQTVERAIEGIHILQEFVETDDLLCLDHLPVSPSGLQALANTYTQLKADLATAKQGLEHYADVENWYALDPNWPKWNYCGDSDGNGYDLARQTLDKIGKE